MNDEIYDDGIIVVNYNPISKNDVGDTITINQNDGDQNVTTKKKTKQMTCAVLLSVILLLSVNRN